MLVQFVVKVSKLCNLRCSYCYEYPELANPARMSLEQIGEMFGHLAGYYREVAPDAELRFIWHGGEPLVQEPAYYRAIFAEQGRHFGEMNVVNWVQTNLTLLDDERIDLLRNDFDGVGISIDLFGDLRLNLAGRPSQPRVLENMARLQAAGVPHGCITVLTRKNLPHLERIFRFYESLDYSFRVLPLFHGAYEEQHLGYEVTGHEVLAALCRLADLWLASDTRIRISPITEQLGELLRSRAPGFQPVYYDRRSWETVVLINTNGDLYSQADAYDAERSWGNIFRSPMAEILGSEPRARSVLDAESRMATACLHCSYFGACNGFPLAEDNRRYADAIHGGRVACVVERGLFHHLERRLHEAEARFGAGIWQRLEQLPDDAPSGPRSQLSTEPSGPPP
ncbi:MAG TPA: radical SAM protein [Kofleriaceae bacterium]